MHNIDKKEPTSLDIVDAHRAGNHVAAMLMLAKLPAKEREGVRAILAIRDPDKLRKKLVSLGFSPEQIDPLPAMP